MPHLDGFAVMQMLQAEPDLRSVPILVLTADGTRADTASGISGGSERLSDQASGRSRSAAADPQSAGDQLSQRTARSEGGGGPTFSASPRSTPSPRMWRFSTRTEPSSPRTAAWRQFSEANDGDTYACGIGANYLAVCEQAVRPGGRSGLGVARGIRQVMAGETQEFHLEYPCHSPVEQRWFTVRVTPFVGEGPVRVVVAHENIYRTQAGQRGVGAGPMGDGAAVWRAPQSTVTI